MTSLERPEIFLLSLAFQSFLDEIYSSLFDGLAQSAQLKRAKSLGGAMRYLADNNPKVILVTDSGLRKRGNRPVLEKVQSYLATGGLVIIGLHFPNFTKMDVFDNFFKEHFGLPWEHGDYHRSTFQFNPSCTLPSAIVKISFPPPYSMKVLHVKNARSEEKIFVPVSKAVTESRVFSPELVDQAQAAIVGAKVGNGFLVYVGDVNGEQGSDKVILNLCGL